LADFYSSDTHYFHKNVIKYCNRPFKDVSHMNEMLIAKHNSVVSPDDTWHFVGDFAFCGAQKHSEILNRLNGYKIIYMGNHDMQNYKPEKMLKLGWDEAYDKPVDREYRGKKFRFCHFPFDNQDHEDSVVRYKEIRPSREGCDYLICGHIHEKWGVLDNMINVGVDCWDFTPLSLDQIFERLGIS
jgi:calcineurin-like phosphoesterase family protein